MDLLNHIYTRRGERVHMPRFGTRIPDLTFEPLDQFTLDIVQEDLLQVINFDPRVKLLDFVITPLYDQNTIVASAKLLYIELNIVDNMDLNIIFEGQ
jgi:phage baseplate assembly protein W